MKNTEDLELKKMIEASKAKKAVQEAQEAEKKLNLEVKRYLVDADIPKVQRFLFKAMVLQGEHPELADFINPDNLGEVSFLYDLLTTMYEGKKALMI